METILFSGRNQYVIMAPQTRQHIKKQIESSALLCAVNLWSLQVFYLHCLYGQLEICIFWAATFFISDTSQR